MKCEAYLLKGDLYFDKKLSSFAIRGSSRFVLNAWILAEFCTKSSCAKTTEAQLKNIVKVINNIFKFLSVFPISQKKGGIFFEDTSRYEIPTLAQGKLGLPWNVAVV